MLKGDMRKQAILDAAQALFFEKGYLATSIQDILVALDCSKGSFYHHFESKLQVLTALCQQYAQESFAQFRAGQYSTTLEQLNGLLYCAMPFRQGAEQLLAMMLPLYDNPEGEVVFAALFAAQQTLFYPELEKSLAMLRAAGTVYYTMSELPQLLWDTYTVLYKKLMGVAAALHAGQAQPHVMPLLNTARFMWERLLDAPYGSIEIVRSDEAQGAIQHAVRAVLATENKL